MNKVILMGRLTRDAQTRYAEGAEPMAISRFTLAVDRRVRSDQEGQSADFISCVAFGKTERDKVCGRRSHSDWKLYKQRWTQGLHNRCRH